MHTSRSVDAFYLNMFCAESFWQIKVPLSMEPFPNAGFSSRPRGNNPQRAFEKGSVLKKTKKTCWVIGRTFFLSQSE